MTALSCCPNNNNTNLSLNTDCKIPPEWENKKCIANTKHYSSDFTVPKSISPQHRSVWKHQINILMHPWPSKPHIGQSACCYNLEVRWLSDIHVSCKSSLSCLVLLWWRHSSGLRAMVLGITSPSPLNRKYRTCYPCFFFYKVKEVNGGERERLRREREVSTWHWPPSSVSFSTR